MAKHDLINGMVYRAGTPLGLVQRILRSGVALWNRPTTSTFLRTASTATSQHIHDGHSLTDTYANTDVLPTLHQVITGSAPVYQVTHTKATIPGSATSFRWPYYTGPATPFVNPRWDAGTFDTLMQVERGLTASSVAMPYTDPGVFLEDLRFELLFISNAVQNARTTPPDYILWGIWPGTDMPGWEAILEDEHYRHKLRADYLTWKIKQLHPSLPADWRVWLFPGFELVRRLIADLATGGIWPGPELTYPELLRDAIHPDDKLEVGMSVLVATMLYQVNLSTLGPSVYAFGDRVSNAEMDYWMARAWEIASAYEPCGMGGTQGADTAWQLAINGDYHPAITTTAELAAATGGGQINAVWNGRDGAVPADAVSVISAAGVVGPAFTPALPAPTGRYIELPADQYHTITGLTFPNGVWQAALVEFVNVPNIRRVWAGSVNSANDYAGPYSSPGAGLSAWTAQQNGNWACNLSVGVYMPGEDNVASTKNPLLNPLRYENTTESNVPVGWWMGPSVRGVRHPDGEIVEVATNGAYPTTGSNALQRFRLGLDLEGSNPPPGSTVRIWGWVVMDRAPTEQEWADMFDWLSAKALKPYEDQPLSISTLGKAYPTEGDTIHINKQISGGIPVDGVLTLDGVDVTGDATDTGATLVYVVPAGGSTDRVLVWTPVSGSTVSQTVSASILSRSAVYFDNTDAPLGTTTTLTTRGALSRVFTEVAFTGGASAVMQADGLALNGHILRNSTALGTYSRMTILLDVTRRAAPVSGAGELVAINSSGVAAARFWLRYTTTNFQVMGPNGVAINFAQIGGYGDRQVIAAAIDLTAGVMTAVDVDGIEQSAAVSTGPISITRVEIGKACLATIHRCAIILEA